MRVHAVGREDVPPIEMPARFKHDYAYFITPPGERGAPLELPLHEFWVSLDDARRWLEEGVLVLVSPLDSEYQAEAEISEEQERWLEWLVKHEIQHVRLEP